MTVVHRVIDTNVAVVANRQHPGASDDCVSECGKALQRIMSKGRLYIDDSGGIVQEYRRHLAAKGQPGPGDAFLKWVLTNEWAQKRVARVRIEADAFELALQSVDPSDRKFIRVAASVAERPPIVQALDSKWLGWSKVLEGLSVAIEWPCKAEVELNFRKKEKRLP